MPVTSWNVEYWEGTYEVQTDDQGNKTLKYNKIRQLQDKDTIENDHSLLVFLSISGYAPSGDAGGYYKADVYTDAYANEQSDTGKYYNIRPKAVLAYGETLTVAEEYQPVYQQDAGDQPIEITNYATDSNGNPIPGFPSTGGTDTYVLAFGPLSGESVDNYTIVTLTNTVEMYDADVKNNVPGPTPTSESSNQQ